MMVESVRRCREFTGPTPHSVAIMAKPTNKRPVEHLILERRRREDLAEEAAADTKYQKQCDLRSEWEKATDKRIQRNTVTRRVKGLLQTERFSLEDRRERLRELLLAEEQQYIDEMEAKEETVIERQAKMRERAKFLKEKREQERLALVQEKLEQRWREECEELRSKISKRNLDEIFTERQQQLKFKDDKKYQDAEVEQFYADLWEKDRVAKIQKEEIQAQEQMERNKEMLEVLQLQNAANEKKREEEKQLKQMEAEWLKEEATLRAEEEEMIKQEKLKKQVTQRRSRDVSIKLKKKREAKEKQEELALDMKIMEKLLEDTKNEAIEDKERKIRQREENLRFMKYVESNRKEEEEREKMLEKFVNEEVEKQWEKRMNQYRQERSARKRLLDNVMMTREQQINERRIQEELENEVLRLEREAMKKSIEEQKRLEMEREALVHRRNLDYQRDLDMQIDYRRRVRSREKEQDIAEFTSGQEAEEEYKRKLKEALELSPTTTKIHPARRKMNASIRRVQSS